MPILKENLSTLECDVHEVLEGGDHYIITGYVKAIARNEEKNPLIFYKGSIRSLNVPLESNK